MKIEVYEILNWFHNNYKDEVVQTHTIESDSKENCFKKVYALERSSRYDNARHYEIANTKIYNEYLQWKHTGVTLAMYYGSVTVD